MLRKIVDAPERGKGLWRPKKGGGYFYITSYGAVQSEINQADLDKMRIAHGTCYPSEGQAQKAAPMMAYSNKLIAAALMADPDAGEQIRDEREWTVVLNDDDRFSSFLDTSDCWYMPIPHVHTPQQAEEMARILNEEFGK